MLAHDLFPEMIKYFKIILFTAFILISGSALNAQSKLLITDVKIGKGDSKFENYSDKTANLASDIPVTILLYRENNVSYYSCFLYTQRGRRLKLVVQDYVLYGDEKINTDRQVIRQRMDATIDTERMMGVTEEQVLYNKDSGAKLRVIYRFELLY